MDINDELYPGYWKPSASDRQAVIEYLFRTGRDKLSRATASNVDGIVKRYCGELEELGAQKESDLLYAMYRKAWGGN